MVPRSALAAGHDTYEDERRYLRPDGTVVWASSHVTLVRDEAGEPQYFFTQLQDITGRKQMEQELAHQALHDSLTGLPNRALLTDRLVHGLAGSRGAAGQLGVMFLDVDHFKVVNDSLGHTFGRRLLRQVGATGSRRAIRPGDTVARFGGDEFVVVCDDVSDARDRADRRARARRAERAVARSGTRSMTRHRQPRHRRSPTTSATPESLLRDSDAAMYRAKERGRGRIELFDDALRSKAERRTARPPRRCAARSSAKSSPSTTSRSSTSRRGRW